MTKKKIFKKVVEYNLTDEDISNIKEIWLSFLGMLLFLILIFSSFSIFVVTHSHELALFVIFSSTLGFLTGLIIITLIILFSVREVSWEEV